MFRVLLVVPLALLLATGALAQKVKNGTASGTGFSGSAASGGTITTVPADVSLVVTQFCSDDVRSFNITDGTNVVIPTWIDFTDHPCIDYSPGVVVPGGTSLVCHPTGAFGFGTRCLLNGILTK